MEEMSKHGQIGRAAMKADMDRKTARKYLDAGASPSQLKQQRTWRTREDPFAAHATQIEAWLTATPALQATTVLELLEKHAPGEYGPQHLRTLQRKIQRWRATQGPDREAFFTQRHRPGEAMQIDFTHATELAVTIANSVFTHLLCVVVLPFSNWQWATVCLGESLLALKGGLQRALFQLGRAPQFVQTDNSTAATHAIPSARAATDGRRGFNEDYLALCTHYGLTPRTTGVGEKEQNGDVEASHRALKNRLAQALLVRGSNEFESVEAWQTFIDGVVRTANKSRGERLAQEIEAMRPVLAASLPEYVEYRLRVSDGSTVRVKNNAYSVPSRLIGQWVQVRLSEQHLEVWYAGALQLRCERLRGDGRAKIDYRHIIWSLVQKPGAFARYIWREELFPTTTFRRAYDAITGRDAGVRGDLCYLRVLHLAATVSETAVEQTLAAMLEAGTPITADAVREQIGAAVRPERPTLTAPEVDLRAYDALLQEVGT
jgi:hypothetical protein